MFAGLKLVIPTSTAVTGAGSSATINANGSVTFTSCATLSLNGVFSSTYDDYTVVMRLNTSVGDDFAHRFRISGADNSTASSYVNQYIDANGTLYSGGRLTTNYGRGAYSAATQRSGYVLHFYGPFLTQPTAYRSISVADASSAYIFDVAGTHNQSTSYDGITFLQTASGLFTGLVCVYGMRK